jgi:uncharacterized membrane protein YdjX (TVP38/TMEM64 family)
MSPLDRPVPPSGEEIHLPGPSAQPIALAVGITLLLLGVVEGLWYLVAGAAITVVTLYLWIRGAVAEYRHLPESHDH